MNFLFVTDRVNAQGDPNINLAKNLEKCLSRDHKVYFMGHDTDKSKQNDFCFYYPWDEKVREVFFSLNGKSTFGKIKTLLSHPFLSFLGIFKVFNIDLIDRKYKKQLEYICKKYDIDAAISLSAPFYTAKGLSKADIKAKKLVMMFDPYAKHHIFGNKRTEKMEKAVFDAAHHIFVPKLIFDLYNRNNISHIDFPCLVTETDTAPAENLFDKTKTNILFCGSLYADIRSPEYLYELVKKSDNPDLHITIVGGVYGKFSDEFNAKYENFIKDRVTLAGKVSREKAREYIAAADIVVNIGNTVENMLPSKVFECIATGKRVLNICQIDRCPSLPYFEKYGNCLSLCTKDAITADTLAAFDSFVKNPSFVPADRIMEDFIEATPQYVTEQILNCL